MLFIVTKGFFKDNEIQDITVHHITDQAKNRINEGKLLILRNITGTYIYVLALKNNIFYQITNRGSTISNRLTGYKPK